MSVVYDELLAKLCLYNIFQRDINGSVLTITHDQLSVVILRSQSWQDQDMCVRCRDAILDFVIQMTLRVNESLLVSSLSIRFRSVSHSWHSWKWTTHLIWHSRAFCSDNLPTTLHVEHDNVTSRVVRHLMCGAELRSVCVTCPINFDKIKIFVTRYTGAKQWLRTANCISSSSTAPRLSSGSSASLSKCIISARKHSRTNSSAVCRKTRQRDLGKSSSIVHHHHLRQQKKLLKAIIKVTWSYSSRLWCAAETSPTRDHWAVSCAWCVSLVLWHLYRWLPRRQDRRDCRHIKSDLARESKEHLVEVFCCI